MKNVLISDTRDNTKTELFAAQLVEVRAVGQTMPDKFKRSNDELMRLARAVAPDPSIFDEAAPYFLCSRISTKSLDAYHTRMHESTLRNFAVEAAEGRAVLLGHDDENSNGLPVGYSLTGDYDGISGEEGAVYSYAYILPGTKEADQLIRACKAATVRDVSVGFYGGKHLCSICNKDIWRSGECPHWPGKYYSVEDPTALSDGIERQTTEQLCYAWIHEAHLSEYSAVYDGATPGAVILKAQRMIGAGQMDSTTVQMLNQRYRGLRLEMPTARVQSPVEPQKELVMTQPNGNGNGNGNSASGPNDGRAAVQSAAEPTARLAEIRTALGLGEDADVLAVVRELTTEAELGRRYRANLIEAALTEGVRAKGDKFDRAAYEARFRLADLQEVETMRALWQEQADAVLPQGRQTQETAERVNEPAPETVPTAPLTPIAAFRA